MTAYSRSELVLVNVDDRSEKQETRGQGMPGEAQLFYVKTTTDDGIFYQRATTVPRSDFVDDPSSPLSDEILMVVVKTHVREQDNRLDK